MHPTMEPLPSTVPAFLSKLWTLVEDPQTNHLIHWDMHGQSFHVYDQARFAKEVLPLYFKHNNIASFIRQLNMYGFRKVTSVDSGSLKSDKDDMEFQHPYFMRGQEHLLEMIKRKVTSVGGRDDMKVRPEDVNKVLHDVTAIKGRQDGMASKLESVKRENEALWREVASLRQKHNKQQQIVNKLIQFLVHLMSSRGLGTKRKMPLMLPDPSQIEAARAGDSQDLALESFDDDLNIPSVLSRLANNSKGQGPNRIITTPPKPGDLFPEIGGPVIHDVTDTLDTGYSPSGKKSPLKRERSPSLSDDGEVFEAKRRRPSCIEVSDILDQPAVSMPQRASRPQAVPVPRNTTVHGPADMTQLEETQQLISSLNDEASEKSMNSPDPNPDSISGTKSETSSRPSLSRQNSASLHQDMSDQLDNMQNDIDSLKDIIESQNYLNLDPNIIMGLFHPDSPLPNLQEVSPLFDGDDSGSGPSTSVNIQQGTPGTIRGNELITYTAPEDMPNLLDLADDNTDGMKHPPAYINTNFLNPDGRGSLSTPSLEPLTPGFDHLKHSIPQIQINSDELD